MKRSILAIVLLTAAAATAVAQKTTVSLLDLGGGSEVSDKEVVAVTDSLAAALDRTGTCDVIAPPQRDPLLAQRGFWNEGIRNLPERLAVAGRCLNADRMIGGQLEHAPAGFSVSLELVDVASGAVVGLHRQDRLADLGAVCGALTDAVRQFSGALAVQRGDSLKPQAARGSYKVDSRPAGAKLFIDGLARGATPARVDSLLAGPHQLFLDLDKYRRTYYLIHVRKGGLDSVSLRLETRKSAEPDRPVPGNPQANQPEMLHSKDNQPTNAALISGDIPDKGAYVAVDKNPEPLKMPQPVYPPIAKKAGIGGKVFVQMLVDTNGQVLRADISKSSGNKSLDDAAIKAAQQWTFTPAIGPDKQPVRVWVMQTFQFKLK